MTISEKVISISKLSDLIIEISDSIDDVTLFLIIGNIYKLYYSVL